MMEKDKEVFLVDGKNLNELRVVDLKKELDKRSLSKTGSKVELMKRLKTQLRLEKLQDDVGSEDEIPNKKLSESVGEKSDLVKQYLEKQQRNYEQMRQEKEQYQKESEIESSHDDSEIDSPANKGLKDSKLKDDKPASPASSDVLTKDSNQEKSEKRKNSTSSFSDSEPPMKKVPLILENVEPTIDDDDIEQESLSKKCEDKESEEEEKQAIPKQTNKDDNIQLTDNINKEEKTQRKQLPKRITSSSIKEMFGDIKPKQTMKTQDEINIKDENNDRRIISDEKDDNDDNIEIKRTITQDIKKSPIKDLEENNEITMEVGTDTSDNEIGSIRDENRTVEFKGTDSSVNKKESPNLNKPKPISPPTVDNSQVNRKVITTQVSKMEVDDPLKPIRERSPSPPRHPASSVLIVSNLVRPFTINQLKTILNRNGKMIDEYFWIDKIKTHCYVVYSSEKDAEEIRSILHNSRWPSSNPKLLNVDFSTYMEVYRHLSIDNPQAAEKMSFQLIRNKESVNKDNKKVDNYMKDSDRHQRENQNPIEYERHVTNRDDKDRYREKYKDRDADKQTVRTHRMERDRDRGNREYTKRDNVREWDRGKMKQSISPEIRRRQRSPRNNREIKESLHQEEERFEGPAIDAPAKLLDDLFHKTRAHPSIYWLPLTDEGAVARDAKRKFEKEEKERMRREKEEEERQQRRKELYETERDDQNRRSSS